MTTRIVSIACIIIILSSNYGMTGKDKKPKEHIAPKYQEWFELVTYYISSVEKDIFFSLKDDRSRDLFIDSFWRHRDPTRGTPQNEFKDELIRRFEWVNRYLRGGGKPGWRSDRGRIFMLLGEPISKTRVETIDVYPAEIWYYYGEPGSGLPSHFGLIFYKKSGAGDYKLYDPFADGPDSLFLQWKAYERYDYEKVYEKLKSASPDLADVALSVVPGEIPYDYQPVHESSIILSKIQDYQKEKADTEYAKYFLKYDGLVDVEYTVNYIPQKSLFATSNQQLLNTCFIHYALKLRTISVDTYKEKSYTNFELNGTIKDQKDTILFQYKKNFPLYFDDTQLAQLKKNGLIFEDMIPVIPGNHKLQILLKNTISKEFTFSEHSFAIPETAAHINEPLIAYAFNNNPSDTLKPFTFSPMQFDVDPDITFVSSDTIYLYYSLNNLIPGKPYTITITMTEGEKILRTFSHPVTPQQKFYEAYEPIPAGDLMPGSYTITIAANDSQNAALPPVKTLFYVTALGKIGRADSASRTLSFGNKFLINQILADQYFAVGNYAIALDHYQQAYHEKKDYLPTIKRMMEALLLLKKESAAISLIENTIIKNADPDYYFLCGKAYEQTQNYEKTVYYYLESLKLSRNVKTLNALGLFYLKRQKLAEAKAVLTESLIIKPEQKEIIAVMGKMK